MTVVSSLTLGTQTITALQNIVGTDNVLTDLEDLYVYSFEKIYQEKNIAKIDAVVKTESRRKIERVQKLSLEKGFSIALRSRTFNLNNASEPIIVLDDIPPPNLKPYKGTTVAFTKNFEEFLEAKTGNMMKIALAQKLLFLKKPTTQCDECDACSSYCTASQYFGGIETWSAKGRMLLIKGVMKGEMSISPKLIDVLYTCSNCGLCFAECLEESKFQRAIQDFRRQVALGGLVPQGFKIASENILTAGDPSGIPPQKRLSWLGKAPKLQIKKKADILYWVGCTVATRTPNTAKAVTNILNAAGADFTILGEEEGCCGYIQLASGLWDEAKKTALRLINQIKEVKANLITTSCAGCYYTFSKLFRDPLDVEIPCDVLHTSQLIENLMREEQLDLKGRDLKVSYHDPCSLGRHTGVYDSPRNVLRKIPKLQLIETRLSKSRARCCGGGGGLWSHNNKVSLNSALKRLTEDVVPLKVKTLVTACPLCQMNFRYASSRKSLSVTTYDLAEIVESALVEQPTRPLRSNFAHLSAEFRSKT